MRNMEHRSTALYTSLVFAGIFAAAVLGMRWPLVNSMPFTGDGNEFRLPRQYKQSVTPNNPFLAEYSNSTVDGPSLVEDGALDYNVSDDLIIAGFSGQTSRVKQNPIADKSSDPFSRAIVKMSSVKTHTEREVRRNKLSIRYWLERENNVCDLSVDIFMYAPEGYVESARRENYHDEGCDGVPEFSWKPHVTDNAKVNSYRERIMSLFGE